jgi:hypothetical protein
MGTDTVLSGMKEIMDHCGAIGLQRTESTILQLKTQYGFPMRKMLGIWVSDKLLISEWRRKFVAGEIDPAPSTRPEPPLSRRAASKERK